MQKLSGLLEDYCLRCSEYIRSFFYPEEFAAALHYLKPDKAPGLDSISPEHLIHAGTGLKFWLSGFLSSCLRQLKIPKVWKRALVVAIPKPSKPVEDPQS